eukprot:m.208667 g.208667  ORF g.208667 m.208667 type:complete len:294 (+) comp22080_c2_seq1:932-1813(+)
MKGWLLTIDDTTGRRLNFVNVPMERKPIDVNAIASKIPGAQLQTSKRSRRLSEEGDAGEDIEGLADADIPDETHMALLTLRSEFPTEKFPSLPPIVMQHQLYTHIPQRTMADRQLAELRQKNVVILFKMGVVLNDYAVILQEDFVRHVERTCIEGCGDAARSAAARRFLDTVVKVHKACSLAKKDLLGHYGFHDEDVAHLIRSGLLTLRDEQSFWLNLPNMGDFMTDLHAGRKELRDIIKRAKYKEVLVSSLLERGKLKKSKLSIKYHIDDAVGADLVTSSDTTSGPLLKNKD